MLSKFTTFLAALAALGTVSAAPVHSANPIARRGCDGHEPHLTVAIGPWMTANWLHIGNGQSTDFAVGPSTKWLTTDPWTHYKVEVHSYKGPGQWLGPDAAGAELIDRKFGDIMIDKAQLQPEACDYTIQLSPNGDISPPVDGIYSTYCYQK